MTPLYVRISRQQIIRTTFHFRWENPYTRNRAKPIFVPSRYLERLWRYKVSVMVKDSLEIINSDLYSFLEMSIITFFQESCLGIGKREVAGTRKWLKISFLFARGYLGNRMSYRDKWKSVLKGKIPRFQRSFTRCLKVGSLRLRFRFMETSLSSYSQPWKQRWKRFISIRGIASCLFSPFLRIVQNLDNCSPRWNIVTMFPLRRA